VNLTLSLLAGLLLLLPGIASVAAWNHGGHAAARRPELPLTSITALFALLTASIIAHVGGYLFIGILRSALVEAGSLLGWTIGPVMPDPYLTAFSFSLGQTFNGAEALSARDGLASLAVFTSAVAAETILAFAILRNAGLDIVIEPFDLRGQGWVYENVVRPLRHGYRPIAYVFTDSIHDDRGVGYEGVIADIRQGADGEIKALCLAEPSRFIYELRKAKARTLFSGGRKEPDVEIYDSEWLGGVIAIEPGRIRNIVIHNIRQEAADDVVEDPAVSDVEDSQDGS